MGKEKGVRYIKPDFYDKFKCVADKCPDTCCAGWQIVIDEDSLERYGAVGGEFGRRLVNNIDWQEGSFYQYNRRCAFLNESNLCDLYTALGSDALCNTCKNYPRHTEEYEGLRELSLSLSCPVAAEMILAQENFPKFVEYEDEKEEELAEEFEDFDFMMFTQLEDARTLVMKHLREATGALEEKLCCYLGFAKALQDCIEREAYCEIDEVIRSCENAGPDKYAKTEAGAGLGFFLSKGEVEVTKSGRRFCHRNTLLQHMFRLERLREEWTQVLEVLQEKLYAEGEAAYEAKVELFEQYLQEEEERQKQWENIGIKLFVFFLFTYFCGAVYDDWIYSKMALAVESVRFIRELYMVRWLQTGTLTLDDYAELAYRYAREIEHSDLNLNTLEELFMNELSA